MQVIQTVNDTIRVLFNPSVEDFRLLDFLLVQDKQGKFLAQIIEIYDDKYDASQNVARIKLFYRVDENGGIFDYDHYTPSKECEIKKINKREIITFINEGKKSLTIGLDALEQKPFDINLDFFKNRATVFADKLDQSNVLCAHFAKAFTRYGEHSVIIDYTGSLQIENAKKLSATKDLKLPLDFYSIDYIWEKGLATASLETQAVCRDIFNEIQTFIQNTPDGFIPFNKFLRVIQEQQKTTPIVELTVLLNNLRAYQKNSIFAQYKRDIETFKKALNENEIVIIDLSPLKTQWHKEFFEYTIRTIEKDAFLFARLNDSNSDVDLINFIYDKKPEVCFIPSISYNYKKLPHITERTKNYILLPTLNPRRDFAHANFEINSMSNNECALFGENSENFIFAIKNNIFEIKKEEKPIAKKKIRLSFSNSNALDVRENSGSITEEELDFFQQFNEAQELAGQSFENKEDEKPVLEELKTGEKIILEEIDPEELIQQPNTQTQQTPVVAEVSEVEEEIYEEEITQVVFEQEPQNSIEETVEEEIYVEQVQEEAQTFIEDTSVNIEPTEEEQKEISQKFEDILDGVDEEPATPSFEDEMDSLKSLAAQSIEETFSEVVDDEVEQDEQGEEIVENDPNTVIIGDDIKIDIEDALSTEGQDELPIFKDKDKDDIQKQEFKSGDIVEHEKYGRGEVIKVINYADRSLLQINFDEVGKRLLDPDIAKIKVVG